MVGHCYCYHGYQPISKKMRAMESDFANEKEKQPELVRQEKSVVLLPNAEQKLGGGGGIVVPEAVEGTKTYPTPSTKLVVPKSSVRDSGKQRNSNVTRRRINYSTSQFIAAIQYGGY